VHVVDNGQVDVAAVAAATAPYDVVLMDLQMPEMDGYTATGRIRQRLDRHEMPIVAMSANAMASDREACLAAGMNEHVGKPFDLDHLVALLRRLTRRSDVPAGPEPAAPPAAATRSPLQDAAARAGVDLSAALRRMGGRERAYGRLLDNFVRDLASLPSELSALAAAGRTAELQRHAHTVKGLAATLGVGALATRAAAAESALRGATPATAGALAQSLGDEIASARAALAGLSAALRQDADRRAPPSPAADGLPAAAGGALDAALQRLSSLLSASDMDALAAMDELRRAHAAALGDRLEPLEDAVARLDFERALKTCGALMEGSRA
jgi:CheY-like chemotaxis protein